jgi:hypothetical protein
LIVGYIIADIYFGISWAELYRAELDVRVLFVPARTGRHRGCLEDPAVPVADTEDSSSEIIIVDRIHFGRLRL